MNWHLGHVVIDKLSKDDEQRVLRFGQDVGLGPIL